MQSNFPPPPSPNMSRQETKCVIFPKGIWKYLRRGVTFGQTGRVFPFVWLTHELEPRLRTGRINWMVYAFNVALIFAYSSFVLCRCVQKNMDATVSVGTKLYMRLIAVYYLFPSLFHATFIIHRQDILSLSSHIVKFMTWIDETLETGSRKLMRLCQFFMVYIFWAFNAISVLLTIYAFIAPDSPEMVSSLFADRRVSIRTLCCLFQGYVEYTFHSHCFLIVYFIFGCLFSTWIALAEIRTWINPTFRSKSKLFLQTYNSTLLLIQMTSDVFLSFIVPFGKLLIIVIIVFCTYSAVRLHGFVALCIGMMGVTLTVFLMMVFSSLAEVNLVSVKILQELRQLGYFDKKRILGRRLRALNVVKFWMRSSYYVDKMLVLTMMNMILQSSISFLVANPTK